VVGFSRLDPASQTTIFSTGHTFRPIPCLLDGQPIADNSCAYDSLPSARSWKACEGCHDDPQNVFLGGRGTLKTLVDVVWVDLNGNQTIDAYPTDTGYLPKVKLNQPTEFTYTDETITAAEGAEFNARTVGEGLYDNGDKSIGVHNPFLARALIQANIQELLATYGGYLPAPPAGVQMLMAQPLPGATRTNALTAAHRVANQ
jgi:hypothetical protein